MNQHINLETQEETKQIDPSEYMTSEEYYEQYGQYEGEQPATPEEIEMYDDEIHDDESEQL